MYTTRYLAHDYRTIASVATAIANRSTGIDYLPNYSDWAEISPLKYRNEIEIYVGFEC